MTHRSDRVWLPNDISRCEPKNCSVKLDCARYMAAVPSIGASMADFSVWRTIWGECQQYRPIIQRPEKEPEKREVKPWPTA